MIRPDVRGARDVIPVGLAIGGELGTSLRLDKDRELDREAKDDMLRIDQELQIELFYPVTEKIWAFVEGKAFYDLDLVTEDGERDFEHALERGETWLYFGDLCDSNFSLQVGRQRFREDREWWWDEELDAIRLHYDTWTFHAELGLAQEIAKVRTDTGAIDAEAENVLRTIGSISWSRTRDLALHFFLLWLSSSAAVSRPIRKASTS